MALQTTGVRLSFGKNGGTVFDTVGEGSARSTTLGAPTSTSALSMPVSTAGTSITRLGGGTISGP